MMGVGILFALLSVVSAEQVFEDSPALTALWQATSSGSSEAFINQLIQNREYSQHRASDGRGPMFWAYEFANVDTLALLLHLGVSQEQEDVDGKKPAEFFPHDAEALTKFESDGAAKTEEMASLLSEREEEFYAYQNMADEEEEDEDDEAEEEAPGTKPKVDSIDYADEEDDEDYAKDEM
jgi:ankyrin repeat protein